MNADLPKLLGDPEAVASRMKELHAPHIHPLTVFVEQLRLDVGPEMRIPYFDLWDAGVEAATLFLLEAPGPMAVRTGFVSRNNPDETAKNFFELSVEADIDRKTTVIWNTVPWYIGSGTRIRAATQTDVAEGTQPLPRLLALLPRLSTVVLVGRKAEKVESQFDPDRYTVVTCPHPSPLFVNRASGNCREILDAFRGLARKTD